MDQLAIDLLERLNLGQARDLLDELALPGIGLRTRPAPPSGIPIGASKFGGFPDLPESVPWPERGQTPLPFIAQFNLSETSAFDRLRRLPESGLLLVFYEDFDHDRDAINFGFGPEDNGGWRILHVLEQELRRAQLPAPHPTERDGSTRMRDFVESAVIFHHEMTYPGRDSPLFERVESVIGAESAGNYETWVNEVAKAYGGDAPPFDWWGDGMHRLLGHPFEVQNIDVRRNTQEATETLSWWNDDANRPHSWQDWELLLQIDGDPQPQIEWPGSGTVYFCIPKTDLAQQRFNRVWAVLKAT